MTLLQNLHQVSKILTSLQISLTLEHEEDNIKTGGRKFSRFNDSMKINKRRMSREQVPSITSASGADK